MGFLDAFGSNDPQSEAMRQGLLRMGLALMQAKGNPGQILGQAGTEGVNGMQSFQDRQFKQKLQQDALAEIARKKVIQGREDTSYEDAKRLAALPSKFYTPAQPGGVDATGGIETDTNAPNNMIPGKMDIQKLITGLYSSGIPGSVKEAIALEAQQRRDAPTIHSIGVGGGAYWDQPTGQMKMIPGRPESDKDTNDWKNYTRAVEGGDKRTFPQWLDARDAAKGVKIENYQAPTPVWNPVTKQFELVQTGNHGATPKPLLTPSGTPYQPVPRELPAGLKETIAKNNVELGKIDKAISSVESAPNSFGLKNMVLPDMYLQRNDPGGVEARARVASLSAIRIHDMAGSAQTVMEIKRLQPYIPDMSDKPETVKKKLKLFKEEFTAMKKELEVGKSLAEVSAPSGKSSALTPAEQQELDQLRTRFGK